MRITGLKTDATTGAIMTVDYPHHEVHVGEMYELAYFDATVANSGVISIATISALGFRAHFTFDGAASGDALLELLEGCTVTGGDAITVYNMNRNYSDLASTFVTDATLGGTPTTLVSEFLPGGAKNKASNVATGTRPGLEWITDPDKTYAIRITNLSGSEAECSLAINYYSE